MGKKMMTFISRIPERMHRELKFIALYTGMTMQDLGRYAIQKEIDRFKQQRPDIVIPSDEEMKKPESKDTEDKIVDDMIQ